MADKLAKPITPKDATLVLDPLHPIAGKRAVYLIRHGHTKYNEKGQSSIDRVRGWIDVPIDKGGKDDAEIIAEMCKPLGIETIVCSDLMRTKQTAEIIADILGLPVSAKSPAFRPWNLGDLQGQPSEDAIPYIKHATRNAPDEEIPGGESFNDFKERFLSGLHSMINMVDKGRIHRIGIITHFRDLKLAEAWARAGGKNDYEVDVSGFTNNDLKPCAIVELVPGKDNGWDYRVLFRGFFNVGSKVVPAGPGS